MYRNGIGFTPLPPGASYIPGIVTKGDSVVVSDEDPSIWERIIDFGGDVIRTLPTFRLPTVPTFPNYDPGFGYPDMSRIPTIPAPAEAPSYLWPALGVGLAVLLFSKR